MNGWRKMDGALRQALPLNECLSRLRLPYLVHELPALRPLQGLISPRLLFQWTRLNARLACYVYPPDLRRIRFMRQALQGCLGERAIEAACRRNILYRKWLKVLLHAWPEWKPHECVRLHGEENLRAALARQRGAVLLSGHAYGFNGRVDAVLLEKGYRIGKVGRGNRRYSAPQWRSGATGQNAQRISYGETSWNHLRALKKMHEIIRANGIVHLLIRGRPRGDSGLQIDFYHHRFFLDGDLLRVIETLEAPVLPCFAVCGDDGVLEIAIGQPLAPTVQSIVQGFGGDYASYLRTRPEFAWFWRGLVQQKEFW